MDKLLAILSVFILLMLQIGIFSNLRLLHGTPDVVLVAVIAWALNERVKTSWIWGIAAGVMVGFVSALPFGAVLAGYIAITGFARYLQKRVWQTPLLAMFISILFGTLLMAGIAIVDLTFGGAAFEVQNAFSQIILPTILLNLMISLPIHFLFIDFADWAYPLKDEA
ncbi:MAG: rod shape-determining protein MreD [Anaerolineaceae bacterium]|nr:rod shape-determining protein MreD [Anaerolineaceae bacterium]